MKQLGQDLTQVWTKTKGWDTVSIGLDDGMCRWLGMKDRRERETWT